MNEVQQKAHDWLMSRPDVIRDCNCDAILTKEACQRRREFWRNHEFTKDDQEDLVLRRQFLLCAGCRHFTPIRIPKRLQRIGLVGSGLNPGKQWNSQGGLGR